MLDGLSVKQLEGEMACNVRVAFAGVGGEVRFGEDLRCTCLGDELAQDFERASVASDEIGVTRAEVFIEGVKSFVEKILSTGGGGVKGWVEDEDWEDRGSLQRGVKRRVIRQPISYKLFATGQNSCRAQTTR
jgi:hypothetical protein